ncbi:MAG: Imm70 family immunity protein [Eubacteriaceae bacterium]
MTDLSNYFVTSDGEDFITILQHALEKAASLNTSLEIQSI